MGLCLTLKQIEVNLRILSKMVKMTKFEFLSEVRNWITLHSFIISTQNLCRQGRYYNVVDG